MNETIDKNLILKPSLIYKITNLINSKEYVGQFSGKNFKYYYGSGRLITKAIKKYGKNNFKREIIVSGSCNQNLLDELEKHYIRLHNTTKPYGYNLTHGGKKGTYVEKQLYNPERNRKIGDKNKIIIHQYSLEGVFLNSWDGLIDAANAVGIDNTSITKCAKFEIVTAGKFIWVFNKEDVERKLMDLQESRQLTPVHCYKNKEWYSFTNVHKMSEFAEISFSTAYKHLWKGGGWSDSGVYFSYEILDVLPKKIKKKRAKWITKPLNFYTEQDADGNILKIFDGQEEIVKYLKTSKGHFPRIIRWSKQGIPYNGYFYFSFKKKENQTI